MRKELDEKLVEKYPKIFVDRHEDKMKTLMCWGFTCGDGWYWLIDQLCSSLQWGTDMNGDPQVVAVQVKEKFGMLNFYVKEATPRQRGMITLAQSMSAHMCESCGTTEKMGRTTGWIRNICEDCAPNQKHPWKKNEEE